MIVYALKHDIYGFALPASSGRAEIIQFPVLSMAYALQEAAENCYNRENYQYEQPLALLVAV